LLPTLPTKIQFGDVAMTKDIFFLLSVFVNVILKQLIKLHEKWRRVTGNNISQRHHHVNRKERGIRVIFYLIS
jgi:hypothetical protein